MGTRNLTVVFIDGEYKVAQYGQWDGYPEGQGITALNFAKNLQDDTYREVFSQKVRSAINISADEVEKIYNEKDTWVFDEFSIVHPNLSRDTGANILELIMDSDAGIKLYNEIEFAADSLFCEWLWLIDLDNNTFEGYQGFNRKPLTEEDRFYFLKDKEECGDFRAVKLAAKWSLDNLPNYEEFLSAFKSPEEIDEELSEGAPLF